MAPEHHFTVRISGMTCASCSLLLERKLRAVPGVHNVDINHKTGIGKISTRDDSASCKEQITSVIQKAGYAITGDRTPSTSSRMKNGQKWMEIGTALIVLLVLYKVLQAFDLVSLAPSTSDRLTFGGIFVIGLVAGTSSCLAVTGGLLLAMAAKHNEHHQREQPWQKFLPLLHFNIGRLVSYFILGGLIGLLGRSIQLSTNVTGAISVFVALVMLYLGLTILQIIPKGSFPLRPPKRFSHWIAGLSENDHPAAPFALGALTFFLPCGFTQSLQLIALGSGSFLLGALTMFSFALGTLPSLLGLSAVSSAATGMFSRLFLRFSGTLVVLLAVFNLNNGLALAGINFDAFLPHANGSNGTLPAQNGDVQEVSMTVGPGFYEPSTLTIKAGTPVRWKIDGTQAYGCTSGITIPALHISQTLHSGENIIEFIAPEKKGRLAFSCSMGMVRGSFEVL